MSPKRTATTTHVEIPGIRFIRQPEGALRCTLPGGHESHHRHFYSGELRSGAREGTVWPRRPGEKQAD